MMFYGKTYRFNIHELGGALGDLGTLVPLAIGLIAINGLNPTMVLLIPGLLYIAAGLYYRIPMPVQPLKAVAAIAIASSLSSNLISAAGLLMGIILLFLALSKTINLIVRLFPLPVVRGIQLGIGLLLINSALKLVTKSPFPTSQLSDSLRVVGFTVPLGLVTGIAAMALLLLFVKKRRPTSLPVLGLGLGISLASLGWGMPRFQTGLVLPNFYWPSFADLSSALVLLVIPQIALTLGNAVVATQDAAQQYFGDQARRVSHRALPVTMGLANLAAGFWGGMPVCHGAGGLTAHYRFGARTGGASIIIGGILIAIALFLGKSASKALSLIPYPILGVLLIFVGFQHALLAKKIPRFIDWLTVLAMGLTALLTANIAIAFAVGFSIHYALKYGLILHRKTSLQN
ncbi:MAG: sulfate permease [Chloroflexi bacterium]|nr:sulfate permease [Chloroflexota bacterium]